MVQLGNNWKVKFANVGGPDMCSGLATILSVITSILELYQGIIDSLRIRRVVY